jgi:catechol 2,3-dioxygenase-like lactoylglutathione lyase family enzyme
MRQTVTAAIFCLAGSATLFAQAPVVGVGTFIHVVANLDKTIRFYGERLGLEMNGAPGPRAFAPNAVVESLYDAKGSQSRVAVFKIPGSPLGLEFVEFKDLSQRPSRPGLQKPGASLLAVPVRDVSAVTAKLKEDGAPVMSDQVVRDPDGFYIQLVAAGSSARLSLMVGSMDRTLHLFRDILGFQPERNIAKVPGTDFEVEFRQLKPETGETIGDNSQALIPARIHDPGAGVLRLFVRSVDSLLPTLKAAGLPVVSAGGETVSIGARHVTILRDPDGFFVQIFDQPAGR